MTRVLRPRGRPGFTLVELLVVVALIVVIAALTVAVLNSGYLSSQRVVGGADRVSGWMLIAKQRAKRDGAPRGVRFFLTPAGAINPVPNSYEVREAQYIEAPDPWAPNPDAELNPNGARLVFVYVQDPTPANPMATPPTPSFKIVSRRVFFVSNNQSDLNDFDQRVSVGDYLILPDFATSYRITGIQNPGNSPPLITEPRLPAPPLLTPLNAREIGLATFPDLGPAASNPPGAMPAPLSPTLVTYQFGFQAAPRPLVGEPTLLLGSDVVVDYRAPVTAPPYPTGGLALNGVPGDIGYRDWGTLTTPPSLPPNPAPYWPATTIGVFTTPPPAAPPLAATTPQYFDVLFAPSGAVMYNPNPLLALWVRGADKVAHPRLGDPTSAAPTLLDRREEYDEAGEQVLVIVYTRSGLIATHPLVPPPPAAQPNYDPYRNARDGINSGL